MTSEFRRTDQETYRGIFRRLIKNVSGALKFSSRIENPFCGFNSSRIDFHLLQNRAILLLISFSFHLSSGGIKKIHAWPEDTFQRGGCRLWLICWLRGKPFQLDSSSIATNARYQRSIIHDLRGCLTIQHCHKIQEMAEY